MRERAAALRWLLPLVAVAGIMAAYQLAWRSETEALVVYCAHDAVYAEEVLRGFERRTGIPVVIRYDTEATKSLGLIELISRERDAPRCDVFWNNELLGTLALQSQGLTAPYQGPGWARIPPRYRDPEGHWTGFGARLRVYIVNTDKLAATPEAVDAACAAHDLSRVAIAKPLYGTTLTHYTVLWHQLGPAGLQQWHADWRNRGVNEVDGNARVRDLVAEGVCDLGLTDTDDYFGAVDRGRPVAMVPVRTANGAPIAVPNTVALIRGSRRSAAARRLADYLTSAEVELALARSASRQIPLGPVDETQLPDTVRALQALARDGVPLADVAASRAACLEWLKQRYTR